MHNCIMLNSIENYVTIKLNEILSIEITNKVDINYLRRKKKRILL